HVLEGPQYAIARDGGFAAGTQHRHLLPIARTPSDAAGDLAGAWLRHAPYHRPIGARHAPRGEVGRELGLRLLVLGDDHQSGGVLVEPMDDTRPLHAADAGEARAAMGKKRVDESAVGIAGRGMND